MADGYGCMMIGGAKSTCLNRNRVRTRLQQRARYTPWALVVTVDVAPVSELFTVTFALGTTAPDGSVTIPLMSPDVSDCAMSGKLATVASSNASVKLRTDLQFT